MYWISAHGPGVTPDSIEFIEASRSLLSGNGLSVHGQPLVRFPPVLPLLLSATSLFLHADTLVAARFLVALLFGVNLVLLAICVQKCTAYDAVATACIILVFLCSAPVIQVHARVMSEAPYIALSTAGLLLLAHHLAHPRASLLILAALLTGVAAATRYIGVVLLPSAALALLLLDDRPLKTRSADIAIFSGIACLPLATWLVRNTLTAHATTGRVFAVHLFGIEGVKRLIDSTYRFILPIDVSGWVQVIHIGMALILLCFACMLVCKNAHAQQGHRQLRHFLPAIFVIYAVAYVVFLILSISFFDAATPVDHRLLLPILLPLAAASISVVWSLSETLAQRCVWRGFVGFVLFSVSINASHAISTAEQIHQQGDGYTARSWAQSEILAYLSSLPEPTKIYSNGPEVIRFLARKEAVWIPMPVFPGAGRENEHFQDDMATVAEQCADGTAVIAYFTSITWRWYLPSQEELTSEYGIPLMRKLQDGVIMGSAGP